MARIEPSFSSNQEARRFKGDEKDTVDFLANALPDSCVVFHSIDWLKNNTHDVGIGEIDICIVGPTGRAVIIEQKNGALKKTEKGQLIKKYGSKLKNPNDQIIRSRNALVNSWNKSLQGEPLKLTPLIYLPDHIVSDHGALAVDLSCVVDASNKDELAKIVSNYLALKNNKSKPKKMEAVLNFFRNELELVPDVGALMERQENHYCYHQNKISTLLKQLSFSPRHLLIDGKAGSGKTQLAAEQFSELLKRGKRPLFLCYNRPLADELETLFTNGNGVISNVDRFVHQYMEGRAIYDPADRDIPDLYSSLREMALSEPPPEHWMFDALIIDEAQDFDESRYKFSCHFLKPNSEITVLRDIGQNVYQEGFKFSPTVTLSLENNYRCSEEIVAFTDALLGTDIKKTSEGLSFGINANIQTYEAGQKFFGPLIREIQQYLNDGYSLDDMVVLVGKGQERSWLMKQDQIGMWPIKRFTGKYNEAGEQIYSEGELLVETVYRFKGKQKPVVLLTELDFSEWTDRIKCLIYTGCTRARLGLSVFISNQAEQVFLNKVNKAKEEEAVLE